MSMDAKVPASIPPALKHREKGIRIFTWPKVIYIFPSAIVALICAIGMWSLKDKTYDPTRPIEVASKTHVESGPDGAATPDTTPMGKRERFSTPQNLLGVLFLAVLAFNLLVMALDFPRFELVGVILLILFVLFFVLWLGSFFQLDLMKPIDALFASIYVFANAGFYFMYFLIVSVLLVLMYITRWLDYWEVLPNEILHHHGPLSDLGTLPDHEPEVRQGDPRRPRVRHARGRPAGAPHPQCREGPGAGQRAVHQLQGRGASRS